MKNTIKCILQKIRFRNKCVIGNDVIISNRTVVEGMNSIGNCSHFDGYLGFGSYISAHCDIAMTEIGRYTSVGPRVVVNPGRHPYTYPYVTSCPAFFSTRKQNSGTFVSEDEYDEFNYVDREKQIVSKIGNDCWIGEGALIAGGVTIGDGAVVLAHAVVTKDVEPYSIVGGVPAKHIRFRYSTEDMELLKQFQWWNKPVSWLKDNNELLRDFDKLKKYIEDAK